MSVHMYEGLEHLKQLRGIVLHTSDGRTLQASFNGVFWELLPKNLGIEEASRVLLLLSNTCAGRGRTAAGTDPSSCRLQHAALRSIRWPHRHLKTTSR